MRILVLGAGAVGGYYGGLLVKAGADVTFLVRPRRAEELRRDGLVVRAGEDEILRGAVNIVLADALKGNFDLVLVANKAYDLAGAIEAIAPAVGRGTAIIPLLNGMAQLDALDARFGAERVLGGVCYIAATMTRDGEIRRLGPLDRIMFGDRAGRPSAQVDALAGLFAKVHPNAKASSDIVQDMWEKWVLLAAGAALTCMLRATVGDAMATQDGPFVSTGLIDECAAIAAEHGHAPRPLALEQTRRLLGERGSTWATSMMRDIENGAPRLEADHIIGDLLRHGRDRSAFPLLRAAYSHLQVYEAHQRASQKA